jgi:transposase-like protein
MTGIRTSRVAPALNTSSWTWQGPADNIDGIRIKVRSKGAVTIKVAHLVIGVDVDGRKHALGCWNRWRTGGPCAWGKAGQVSTGGTNAGKPSTEVRFRCR